MIDLKFFYIVELNLQHPQIAKLALSKEFNGQSWLTLTSSTYDNDAQCVEDLKSFMKAKASEFKHAEVTYAENPHLHAEEGDYIDPDFDENALVAMSIKDKKDWLVQAAVLVFGSGEDIPFRRLH